MSREFEDRLIDAVAARQVVEKVWSSLTDMQTIVASYLMEGTDPEDIALNIGCSGQNIHGVMNSMKTKFKKAGG